MHVCTRNRAIATIGAALAWTSVPAVADPIIHYNVGNEFGWNEFNSGFEPWEGEAYLDITKSASTQPAVGSNRTITRQNWPGFSSDDPGFHSVDGGSTVRFAVDGPVDLAHYYDSGLSTITVRAAHRFLPGDTIGPSTSLTHNDFSVSARTRNQDGSFTMHDLWGAGDGYIGLSFQMSGNTHYGWIHISPQSVNAYAWAYESTPNTPITIPIPSAGTLPLLGLAGLAAMKRRRG